MNVLTFLCIILLLLCQYSSCDIGIPAPWVVLNLKMDGIEMAYNLTLVLIDPTLATILWLIIDQLIIHIHWKNIKVIYNFVGSII